MVDVSIKFRVNSLTRTYQTWLDERLFGWSPTPSTNALAQDGDRSLNTVNDTTTVDPDFSDDEIGDYDDLLGYLSLDGKKVKSRSKRGSFADLQKVRRPSHTRQETLLVPNPTLDHDGLHMRTSAAKGDVGKDD